MVIGTFITWYLKSRIQNIEHFLKNPHEVQQQVLTHLLYTAKRTEIGLHYDFESIFSYEEFATRLPLVNYEEIEPLIERARLGEKNILWPGKTKWFAKSSGTTNAKSKFIPITDASLEDCHLKAGKDMLSLYVNNNPTSPIFQGKNFRLGGSQDIHQSSASHFGDLSAIIIQNTPIWADYKSVPSQKIALMSNWEEKLDAIVAEVYKEDITSLAGVPSWMLVLLNHLLQYTNKTTIDQVWPNLEVFFHGGINFTPYAQSYQNILGKNINYYEIYNASEGFFALQDRSAHKEMLLMLDYGVFYEFIPMNEFHSSNRKAISLDQVQLGINYAIVITTNGGLWRYIIGDTIVFTSINPYRIKITGRTKHFINAFGEELIIENAEEALQKACQATQARIIDYTAGPVFMNESQSGKHEWVIEFEKEPTDLKLFTKILDNRLQEINSDYEAKRFNNMTLQEPIIHLGRKNLFHDWMKQRGKLGGQNKVPRLSNDRTFLDTILPLLYES